VKKKVNWKFLETNSPGKYLCMSKIKQEIKFL
jgi:hypothetical protein